MCFFMSKTADFDGSLCDDGGEEGEEDGWADAESDV